MILVQPRDDISVTPCLLQLGIVHEVNALLQISLLSPEGQATTMFGALNRFIARLDADGPSGPSRDGHGAFGFNVLRNKNTDILIEPWYDFIIGINGRQIVRRLNILFLPAY